MMDLDHLGYSRFLDVSFSDGRKMGCFPEMVTKSPEHTYCMCQIC